jgi:HSP20 family protein
VIGETLTLSGVRKPDELNEGARYHRQERGYGKFSRTLQLPYPVSVDKIEADFKSGVLSVRLPRAEQDKPRKIAVTSA